MTPFRIRERVKSALGLSQKPAPEREAAPTFTLIVHGPEDRRQTCEASVGHTVLSCAGNLAAPIASGCSDSSCSTCRIEVLAGDDMLAPRNDTEVATLKANQRPEHLRLGCQATVVSRGGGTLEVRAFEYLE